LIEDKALFLTTTPKQRGRNELKLWSISAIFDHPYMSQDLPIQLHQQWRTKKGWLRAISLLPPLVLGFQPRLVLDGQPTLHSTPFAAMPGRKTSFVVPESVL
jgi:hypothetical protein